MTSKPARRVLLASPAFDGRVCIHFAHSVTKTVRMGIQRGVEVHELYQPGDAIISNARNDLVAEALKHGFDDLIFVDSDQDWEPEWIFTLLAYPVDVVGGTARKKSDDFEAYQVRSTTPFRAGPVPGIITSDDLAIGTGFLRLSRNAMQALWDSSEEYRYQPGAEPTRWMFDIRPVNGLLVGEDVAICDKLRALGFATYIDPAMTCGHTGPKRWQGDFTKWLKARPKAEPEAPKRVKIAVPILSRHRPQALCATLRAFHAAASGLHDIEFGVRTDPNDPETSLALASLPFAVTILNTPRPRTIGAAYNEIIAEMTADIYAPMADDVAPVGAGWDDLIAKALPIGKPGVIAWNDTGSPNQVTYVVATKEWLSIGRGALFAEFFPFWFIDTWLAEVHLLATGRWPTIIADLKLAGPRGTTSGMRDLALWYEFFDKSRLARVVEAQHFANAMGLKVDVAVERAPIIRELDRLSADLTSRAPQIEAAFRSGDQTQAAADYLQTKAAAENYLAAHRQITAA